MYSIDATACTVTCRSIARTLSASAAGIALSALTLLPPAFADDTEVFFGRAPTSSSSLPNVMLILDTSSSMNSTDGTGITRLERMKIALRKIIDSSSNVKLGLMRFNGSNSGGSVLFPVTDIDKEWCAQEDCESITLQYQIGEDSDIVSENLATKIVSLSTAVLPPFLDISLENTAVGLRFTDVVIPQGAQITNATLHLSAGDDSGDGLDLKIRVEQSDDAAPFSASIGDISARISGSSGTSIDWNTGTGAGGISTDAVDVEELLQPLFDRPGWCGGNSIAVIVEGTGAREIVSYASDPDATLSLSLTYDVDSVPDTGGCTQKSIVKSVSSGDDDAEQKRDGSRSMYITSTDLELPEDGGDEQIIGMRFDGMDIPQGATIDSASIEFTVDEKDTGSLSLRIRGEDADDSLTFGSSNRDISDRAETSASVVWSDPPEANVGEEVTSPELKDIVQEIVDRSGWESGNALSILVQRESGSATRTFESYNGDPSAAPRLNVRFTVASGSAGSGVDKLTVRDRLRQIVDDIKYRSGTPIVDAYYEAALYYRGAEIDYGKVRGSPPSATVRVSHPDSYTGGIVLRDPDCSDDDLSSSDCKDEQITGNPTYTSPMVSSCQTNHIVLLSDGGASSNSAKAKVRTLTGLSECEVDSGNETCGRSLATWLNETDHSTTVLGKQNIATYTIGFNLGSSSSAVKFLRDLATRGGGGFYEAETAEELTSVFQSILGEVLSIDTSFVAPGTTVNQFNRLTHRNDIYFAVFKPEKKPTWDGNLKRYAVGTDDAGEINILDVDGATAIDESTGFFAENSQSWWSDDVDGNQVALGGAAEELEFDGTGSVPSRRSFTFTGNSDAIASAGVDLTLNEHALHEDNSNITLDMLGLSGMAGSASELADRREELLKWARGVDIQDEDSDDDTSDWRRHMGDPMHSRPIIMNYANGDETKTSIFVSTNEGFLHAIDRDNGKELYSIIPQELLPNLNTLKENDGVDKHPYGLDGSISVWTDDPNNNLIVDAGEKAFIYVGMRRGGNNYYAFDVSNRLDPKLAWVIKGGADGTSGFEQLGQSWSRMVPANIILSGAERDVLIFSAGYDENQDGNPSLVTNVRTTDNIGRGLFIVDAHTGARLWSGLGVSGGDKQFADMKYSIPSDLRVIDVNFDGYTDQLYVGDMGGQLWRFDLAPYHQSGDLVTGGVIAELNGLGSAGERRFYNEPDVALIARDGERFLSISIGSGWRAHPLSAQVKDRFYMIRSNDIYTAPEGYGKPSDSEGSSYTPITESDLVEVSDANNAETNEYGWYMDLKQNSEKVLSSALTINNQVVFSTYRPEATADDCSPAVGGGAIYVVDVKYGTPVLDIDEDGDVDEDDIDKPLANAGIPPEPTALITDDGPTVLVGPEQPIDPDFSNLTRRTYWIEGSNDD